ncbi:enoyl-CoA hydratase/isomerase family protein [Corynebacterium terpenotabidum]|uniref:Enoyl-CoA hydratase n=1 Tax=Corynebacterium terpenotabidum Y-11 TaxID=1200352 RepID=S4XFH3_9CORY|nr:enoyl-CoA hydratase-related protein [Corynebacterium terpenotabidum]AGP31329.1 enoyl-CoA hydratase [Corynebacterium terpenotabidum Y-11]
MTHSPLTDVPVLVEREVVADGTGCLVRVQFNRPDRLNAVDLDLLTAFGDVMSSVAEVGDDGLPVRAVVLSGAGKTLSAGADLMNVVGGGQDPAAIMAAASRAVLGVLDCPVPVLCALTGKSAGFGVSLGLAADITVMAENGALVLSFADVGLSADGGISQLLPSAVGRQVASRMLLTGERVDAATALSTGLVAETAPDADVVRRTEELAATIAAKPAGAVRGIKRTLSATVRADIVAALDLEAVIQEPLLAGPELKAAAQRFFGR